MAGARARGRRDRDRRAARSGHPRPALRRRRAGPRAGARRDGHLGQGRGAARGGGRGRRGPRGLRRLSAARPLVRRPERDPVAGRRRPTARNRCRQPADDRGRAPRLRARPRPDRRRWSASRTTPAGRCSMRAPSRSAVSSAGSGTTARAGSRAAGPAAWSERTFTGRCSRGIPGSPTGCSRRHSPTERAASHPRSSPLDDDLESQAHSVSSGRARARGGRYT